MGRRKTDPDLLTRALAYAALHGDDAATKHFKMSAKTLQRARANPKDFVQLSDIVADKKDALLDKWTDSVPSALADCVAFVRKATKHLMPEDPESLHAISGAIKILSEAQMNREVLDVWIENNRASTADLASPLERVIDERQAITN